MTTSNAWLNHAEPVAGSIQLKTSLLVPGWNSEEVALGPQLATLGALLREIGRRANVSLTDADGELIDFLDVRLNETRIAFHPAGLATELQPGDRVLVRLVPIGGG